MAKYEVFLPAAREGGFNLTLKVDADNWMAALKAGLTKLGEQGAQVSNLLVDIMEDNSIHVSDTASGRVFRIKELEEASSAPQPLPLAQTAPLPLTQPAAAAPAPTLLEKAPGRELPGGEAPTPREMAAVEPPPEPPRPAAPPQAVSKPTPPPAKPAPEKPAKHAAKVTEKPADRITEKPVVAKPEAPKTAKPAAPPAPRADSVDPRRVEQVDRPSQPISGPIGRSRTQTHIEDVLSDLFERTQDAFSLEAEQGLSFLLDLALEKIPAESGSVFVSNFAANDLELASARGPKAPELKRLKLRMPVGVGIVGFCAQEAVSLAISDTEKDPRFYRTVSDKLGYDTRSILCAPMVSGGRTFGCIEVINKKGTSHFTDSEVAILAYVAHQGAKYLEQISP